MCENSITEINSYEEEESLSELENDEEGIYEELKISVVSGCYNGFFMNISRC